MNKPEQVDKPDLRDLSDMLEAYLDFNECDHANGCSCKGDIWQELWEAFYGATVVRYINSRFSC